mmetsp:Transcript_80297/g.142257  ORF Transcript_80297/g.142257 Transcript_80297/m.142257 type:complete len:278 (+) Transcript_80297:29-862(+)
MFSQSLFSVLSPVCESTMRPNILSRHFFAVLALMAVMVMSSDDSQNDSSCASSSSSSSSCLSDEAHDEMAALQLSRVVSDVKEAKASIDDWIDHHPLKIPRRRAKDSVSEAKAELDEWLDNRVDKFIAIHGTPKMREEHLDTKLGIAPAAHPKHAEAAASAVAVAPAKHREAAASPAAERKLAEVAPAPSAAAGQDGSAVSKSAPSSWSRLSGLHLIRLPLLAVGFLAMMGIVAYTLTLRDSTLRCKAARTAWDQQHVPEGKKLWDDHVEMKNPINH